MIIRINEADTAQYTMDIIGNDNPDDLTIASLIAQTLDFHYRFIAKHHGAMAGTITDLIENINR